MDLLGGMGRDELRVFSWVAAAVFALVAGFWRPRRLYWTALGSVLLFAVLNAGAGVYVLNHFGDSRWSAGGEPPLSVPSFSGTPVVGQFLGPLDSALNGVVGGVNEFLAFKRALPVALDFLGVSGWALLVSFPLAVLAAGISYTVARRRKADFAKYCASVDLLKDELEQIKRQISAGNSGQLLTAGQEVRPEVAVAPAKPLTGVPVKRPDSLDDARAAKETDTT